MHKIASEIMMLERQVHELQASNDLAQTLVHSKYREFHSDGTYCL